MDWTNVNAHGGRYFQVSVVMLQVNKVKVGIPNHIILQFCNTNFTHLLVNVNYFDFSEHRSLAKN